MNTMMACGHSANAQDSDGNPCCVICLGINPGAATVVTPPNLEEREAKCGYCGQLRQSKVSLPFFEYRGEGSRRATDYCKCGYARVAHERGSHHACGNFVPNGAHKFDEYYCGCGGWN